MYLLSRFLADSNRRTRFCRPLTKPLIQGTRLVIVGVSLKRVAKVQLFFKPAIPLPKKIAIFLNFFFTETTPPLATNSYRFEFELITVFSRPQPFLRPFSSFFARLQPEQAQPQPASFLFFLERSLKKFLATYTMQQETIT